MRFFEAAESGDIAAMREFVAEDVVMTWPQSGERFRRRENALAALDAQDDPPTSAGEPVVIGTGDVWGVMLPMRYDAEVRRDVGISQLVDGRISASAEYVAEPFPPKPARAPFVES